MDNLIKRLYAVPDSYFEFVDSIIDYASSDASHYTLIMNYLNNNKESTSSDILYFISTQPDFFDDDVSDSLTEEEYDISIGDDAYSEYIDSGMKSRPIEELWSELEL